jgi:hypothetical protein
MALGPHDFIDPNRLFPNSLNFIENSILEFLQVLFSTFPPKSNSFHYDENPELTEIAIEGRNTDNLISMDTRPKIVVYRGPVGWQNRGQGGGGFVGSANLSRLKRTYTDIQDGTVSINCFAREDLESERIASICSDSLKMFREVLQRSYGFLSIHGAQIGQRAMIRSDSRPELFVTPVIMSTQVTKNWKAQITDPILLRSILMNFVVKQGNIEVLSEEVLVEES